MTTTPVTGQQRLRVDEVLLAGETPGGPALVSIDALVVDAVGLTIVGPRPGVERLVPWSEIAGFEGLRSASLPDGAPATALVLGIRGRPLKFLLPDAAVSGSALAELDREITAHLGAPAPHRVVDPAHAPAGTASAGTGENDAPRLAPPAAVAVPPAAMAVPPTAVPVPPAALSVPPVDRATPPPAVRVPPRLVPLDAGTGAVGAAGAPAARPVPPRAVPLPEPKVRAAASVHSAVPGVRTRVDDDADTEDGADLEAADDAMLVSGPALSKEGRRLRGVRQSKAALAKPLLAADEFEFSSDPSLPRGGPAPGAVIEISRNQRTARRAAVLFVVLVFVATGAGVWYYTKHHTLPGLAQAAPPRNLARDLGVANSTLIGNPAQDPRLASTQAPDLPGWSAKPLSADNPFAMGAASSPAAARASAAAAGSLASCLGVSPDTLSAATGAGGIDTADRTAFVGSRLYGAPAGDPSTASSVSEVVDSTSVVQADAKVFQNAALFATCYEPYAQAMLPYAVSGLGPGQMLDAATVQPMAVPVPAAHSGVHAYGFQVTILGHSGSNGFTVVLDEVAVLGGRVQATLAMDSDVVFPVDAQASLVQTAEARVHAVVDS